MTTEEMEALLAEQAQKIETLTVAASKIQELEDKINPRQEDPDEAYKPKTWKDLDEKVDSKAEAAALRILEEAEKKKDDLRRQEEETAKKNNEEIDKALNKLQEEGLISETKDKMDEGGRQRTQILGMTLRTGGTDIESAARALKSAWDNGLDYDYESNTFVRKGYTPPITRDAVVGSSASRTPSAPQKGTIDVRGIKGDLDEAERRWLANNS